MKSLRHLIIAFVVGLISQVSAEESRNWTQASTGKVISGTLQSKSADNSEAKIKKENSEAVVSLKTKDLSAADQAYISKWTAPAAETPKAAGIVINKQTVLEQAKGGFGVQIAELATVFGSYKIAENDLAAHPEVVIFDGLPGFTPTAPVTYLMPRGKAEALLPKRTGPVSRLKAVAPGFPPGMIIYNYDIRLGAYSRMTIMADAADQVVTVQFKAQNKQVPMRPCDFTTQITTRDFIDVGWGGAVVEVIGTENTKSRYLVNIRGKDTVTWFAPVPLIRQILFNVQEKKKAGRK
jgi:hypothetical protein